MQALFGAFGVASSSADVVLTNIAGRMCKDAEPLGGESGGAGSSPQPALYIYSNGENVEGEARITVPSGKKLEHMGIKVELKGVVELFGERGSGREFVSLVKELASPGILTSNQTYKFGFERVEMPYETYEGIHAVCRYFVRVTVTRSGYAVTNLTKETDFAVQNVEKAAVSDTSVKLEVGIEDCLHIEFEYDKTRMHLADVITGRVNFLLVRIKIKFMELAIIRREVSGPAGSSTSESTTLTRFEVMDGCPVRGERIPLRLYLGGIPALTPSYSNIANSFSVRYFVNLVLVDEEDRRYFKQQEITLWRNALTAT